MSNRYPRPDDIGSPSSDEAASQAQEPVQPEPPHTDYSQPAPATVGTGPNKTLIGIAIAAGVVVLCIIVAAVVFMSNSGDEPTEEPSLVEQKDVGNDSKLKPSQDENLGENLRDQKREGQGSGEGVVELGTPANIDGWKISVEQKQEDGNVQILVRLDPTGDEVGPEPEIRYVGAQGAKVESGDNPLDHSGDVRTYVFEVDDQDELSEGRIEVVDSTQHQTLFKID